ncbi:hypothetical protein G2W53_040610 [Senna tora]|uniref:Uncharacterized protein n=1 Tax=Senna tora TaxID=362788 RepID=A0A834W251_9FABA|nr:hypothetical protein G2W53_040610 [Senna tora]
MHLDEARSVKGRSRRKLSDLVKKKSSQSKYLTELDEAQGVQHHQRSFHIWSRRNLQEWRRPQLLEVKTRTRSHLVRKKRFLDHSIAQTSLGYSWNWSLFSHLLPLDCLASIEAICLPNVNVASIEAICLPNVNAGDDLMIWNLSTNGDFSVKTAYASLNSFDHQSNKGI